MTAPAGDDGEAWVPVRMAAEWACVDRRSVYQWVKRYAVRTVTGSDGRMLVNLPDVVRAEVATRSERDRKLARRERV